MVLQARSGQPAPALGKINIALEPCGLTPTTTPEPLFTSVGAGILGLAPEGLLPSGTWGERGMGVALSLAAWP